MAHPFRKSVPWLLAVVAVCLAVALVRETTPPPRERVSPTSPPNAEGPGTSHEQDDEVETQRSGSEVTSVDSVRRALSARDGLEWRVISSLVTPWGPDVRIRPWVGSVEIRGNDVRVLDRDRLVFERPRQDGAALRREAERLGGWIGDGGALVDVPSIGAGGASSPFSRAPSAVLLVGDDGITLAWEATLEAIPAAAPAGNEAAAQRLVAIAGGAPVRLALPATTDAPLPIRVVLDPVTLAPREILDLRHGATGSALVFDPNPIATSGRTDLRDGDPVDAYRLPVTVERLDGSGRLRGPWARVATALGPEVLEPSQVYAYVSTDPRFEQAMAYLHGDRSLQRAADLGYLGLFPQPIEFVAHGTHLDNSWYAPPTRQIVLGSGGVDDGEDADIILHESGHALHDALVPGFGGGDTRAISEGFADFWAASLTGDACVGDWDATSYGPPCLRRVDDDVAYPGSLTGSVHRDGRIWSALLWDLRGELGPTASEQLALAALREQSWDSTWEEAAEALLRAADRLALPRSRVEPHLARRGFLTRILDIELTGAESLRLELTRDATFLGSPVHALDLFASGRLEFVDTRTPGPVIAPWFVPYAPEDADGLTLRATGDLEDDRFVAEFTWLDPAGHVVVRSRTEWDVARGDLTWCLLDADSSPGTGGLRFFSSGGLGVTPPVDLRWDAHEEAWHDLTGFRGLHPTDLAARIGEAFALTPTEQGFDLHRAAIGRPLAGRGMLLAQPSPFRDVTEIRLYASESATVEVTVHGADGRRLRQLAREPVARGLALWSWDGRDSRGAALPSGRYWVRARGGGVDEVVSVVRIR